MKITQIKKRTTAAALCLLLVCAGAVCAQAEMAVVKNPDPTDRLNLREGASTEDAILHKYYSGVEVEILSGASGDWALVRIGAAEGYMLKEYLATGSQAASVQSAIPLGQVDVTYPQTKLALRAQTSDDSAALGAYENGTMVAVLGVSDGWLHVRVSGDGRMGFMRSAWITQAGDLKNAAVQSEKATLRLSPKAGGKPLGVYRKNVPMAVLFSFEKLEGWSRVRIGNTVGFMQNSDLAYASEPGDAVFSPAVLTVKNPGSFVNLRKEADTKALVVAALTDGTTVSVIGTSGEWSHVLANSEYGYIQSRFLQ